MNDTLSGTDIITVEMSGFTIDANNYTPNERWSSLLCRNVNRDNSEVLASIHDNTFVNILVDGKETFGILGYGSMSITVEDNTIDQFARGGIGFYSGDNEVIGNTLIGPYDGDAITWAPNGIQMGYGASGLIQGNNVSHCGWPGTDWAGTAIMVVDTSNVTVDDNHVHDNEVAISVTDFPEAKYGPTWAGACSDIIVINNLVENNEYGLDIANEVDSVDVEYNNFINNIYDSIDVYVYSGAVIPSPTNIEIHYNNIAGSGDTGLYVGTNITEVNAALNWWGDATGPYQNSTNAAGTGDNVTDNAIYSPWLGAETSVTPMTYYVNPAGSIQAAIDAANPGETIYLEPGTYTENIDINKKISLIGSGSGNDPLVDSILQKDTNERIIKLSASGDSEVNPVLIKDIRVLPDGIYGFEVGNGDSISYVEFDNVHVIGAPTHTIENEVGLKVATDASLCNFAVKDSAFDDCDYGWYFAKTVDITETSIVQFVNVDDTSFSGNDYKGIYVEKLSDATFNRVVVDNNGKSDFWNQIWNGGFDINLKAGNYANLTFNNMTVINNGLGYKEGAGMMIKARDDGSYVSPNNAILDGVLIFGGNYSGNERGIRIGEPGKNNAGPVNVLITSANITGNVQTYSETDGSAYGGVVNHALAEVNATYNWWGDVSGPYNAQTNPNGLGDAVSDNIEYWPYSGCDDDWNPWNDPNSAGSPDGRYIAIGEVIDAYNCWRYNEPAPITEAKITIGDVIDVYNAWRFTDPM